MATDIFQGLSKPELKKRIGELVAEDLRSLPVSAKVFSAVARIQGFDMLPEVVSPEEMNTMIAGGMMELQRGISASGGVPAMLYAQELASGPLYPGTLSAVGHGIYLAKTSVDYPDHPAFPKISKVAHEYAKKEHPLPGVIVRCCMKESVKPADDADLKQFMRENRNRARDVGITDLGTFAAALGLDGYFCDNMCNHNESVLVVVNRGCLVFQNKALQVSPHHPKF